MDNVRIAMNSSEAEVVGIVVSTFERTQESAMHFFLTHLLFQMIIIFWRDLMKDILPVGTNGLVVVFKNEWYAPWISPTVVRRWFSVLTFSDLIVSNTSYVQQSNV